MAKMTYTITITLVNPSRLSFTAQAPFYGSGAQSDCVSFSPAAITIEGERNRSYTEADIFLNVQNSLYNQMLKCLQIHFCAEGARGGITRIQVTADGVPVADRLFTAAFQPYPAFDAPIAFDEAALRQLLFEDDDSFALRTIISHWFTQGQTADHQRRLECVWRTFEQLCNHMRHAAPSKRRKVAEGLDLMVQHLTAHPTQYARVAALVAGETKDTLRRLRWHDMIENNYPETQPGASNLLVSYQKYKLRLCDPYADERVCALMRDILPYRRRELQNYGLFTAIETNLNTKIAQHITRDIDVVALLCHYCYYLRNRLFHGQTLVRGSIFDPHKTDEMRIDLLTSMLTVLTVELINNYRAL